MCDVIHIAVLFQERLAVPFQELLEYINAQIAVLFWLQLVWLAEWWAGIDMRIYAPNESVAQNLEQDHKVILGNHRSDIDWLLGWVVAQKFGSLEICNARSEINDVCSNEQLLSFLSLLLGGSKALMKSSLLRLPGLGLSWWLSDFIFLSRSWEKDKLHLDKCTKSLKNYPVPLCFMIYAEGTRLTPAKLKQSQDYCRKQNMQPYENVMCPRTKGWCLVMSQLRHAVDSVITLTLAFPDLEPGLSTLLNGQPFRVDVYLERYPISDVPENEEETSHWCFNAYRNMDIALKYHNERGCFPGVNIDRPRSRDYHSDWDILHLKDAKNEARREKK
eukprot:gene1999-5074_t